MCLRGGIRISACACVPLGVGTNTAAASVAFKKKSVVSRARRARVASSRASARKTTETSNLGVRRRLASRAIRTRDSRANASAGSSTKGTTSAAAPRYTSAETAACFHPRRRRDAGGRGVRVLVLREDCARARGREHQRARRARAPSATASRRPGQREARMFHRSHHSSGAESRRWGNGAVPVEMAGVTSVAPAATPMRARGAKTTTRGEDDDARRRRRREATTTTRAHPRARRSGRGEHRATLAPRVFSTGFLGRTVGRSRAHS